MKKTFLIICLVVLPSLATAQSGTVAIPGLWSTIQFGTSFPATARKGQLYYKTTGDTLGVWSGTEWVRIVSISGIGDITGVTAGINMTGGGTTGTVTVNADTTDGNTKLATQGDITRGIAAASLDDLSDVDITGASAGNTIVMRASRVWVDSAASGGGSGFDGHKTAAAWFPSTANGADYAVLNSREEVYAFDTTTAETLYVKYLIPGTFTSVDSLTLWVSANSTAGDSVKFIADWLARDDTETIGGAVGGALSVIKDLGTTALVQHRLTITGSFTGIAAGDILLVRVYRDPSVTNDVAVDVNLHDTSLWLH